MKSNTIKTLLVPFFLFLLLFGLQGKTYGGQTFYISTTGSNAGNGSFNTPWRNLEYAVTVAGAGDTIIMRGGTYFMNEVLIDRKKGRGGAPGQYLTIKNFSGEQPFLRYSSRRFIIWADFVRVEGLHLEMPWRFDVFGTGNQIVNNKMTGPQPKYGAIETGGTDVLIEGNYIEYDDTGGNTQDHGIYVHKGKRITVRNNTIIGSKGYGIHLYDEHKSADPAVWAANPFSMKDYLIDGNYVANSQTRSGIIVAKGRGSAYIFLENITIQNNILDGNKDFGIYLREGKDVNLYNNTFYRNGAAPVFINNYASAVTINNNIFETIDVNQNHIKNNSLDPNIVVSTNLYESAPRLVGVTDPSAMVGTARFLDPQNGNFNLLPNSPAIDKGINVGLPYNGAAPDLGAFEFNASVPVELASFQASVSANSVQLNWVTESETNNYGFDIEKSRDDVDFTKVDFVAGHGTVTEVKFYEYFDAGLQPGLYYYRLKQVDLDGSFEYSPTLEISISVPDRFTLNQNYPNPFNPETQIKFEVSDNVHVSLTLFGIKGNQIKTLVNSEYIPGGYSASWDGKNALGKNVASGTYFYRLEISTKQNKKLFSETKRMTLLR